MIYEGNPETLEIGEVLAWGHPSHGLCTDGTLDLGGSESMAYTQPTGNMSGRTMLIQLPDAPGSGMTPEVEASEAAAGRRWLDYALLSGSRSQLYGIPTDLDWIFTDSAGTRWGVTVDITFTSLQGQVDFDFELTEFGNFSGIGARMESRLVEVEDIGQSSPTLTGGTTGEIEVVDANKTGSRAILRVRDKARDDALNVELSTESALGHRIVRPLGWLECVISGAGEDIAIVVNVLADRDTTLGEAFSEADGTITYKCHLWYADGAYWAIPGADFDFTRDYGVRDRLIGYAYDSSGVATPFTWSVETHVDGTQSMTLDDDYYTQDASTTTTTTVTLAWGGSSAEMEMETSSNVSNAGDCDEYGECVFDVGPNGCNSFPSGTVSVAPIPLMTDENRYRSIRADATIWAYTYSPTVFGFYSPAKASPVTPAKYSKVVYRGGTDSSIYTRDAGDPGEFVTFGSDEPVDGLVVFASDDPVCYV